MMLKQFHSLVWENYKVSEKNQNHCEIWEKFLSGTRVLENKRKLKLVVRVKTLTTSEIPEYLEDIFAH